MAADKLTRQQEQAIISRGGNLLVSAAAGSGKTKVLVDRLLGYLLDPVDPANLDEFLIITYTKAAAAELRGKIAKKLTEAIAEHPENRHLQKQIQRLYLTKISTVHGFCSDLLREYAYRLDIAPDFRVADENECLEIRELVMTELLDKAYRDIHSNSDFQAFVDTQGLGRTDVLIPEIISRVYDSAQCHMDPGRWLQSCLESTDIEDITDVSQTIWGSYLLQDLHQYLDCHIRVMKTCILQAEQCDGFEKPVTILKDTLNQLEDLRQSTSWDEIVKKRRIDYGRLTFPRKNPNPELSDRIKEARTACKKGLEKKLKVFADDSAQVLSDLQQSAPATRGLIQLVEQFAFDYLQAKRSRRVLDFSDLEHRTLDLLLGKKRSGATAAAIEIGKRFREIMVDEYQDSNGVQDAIFSVLTAQRKNCFMVGDVKQSIYQFRLADPSIFLEKYRSYVSSENVRNYEGRKVILSHNFRSGIEILDAANAVFRKCMSPQIGGIDYGDEEALREGIAHIPLDSPAVEFCCLQTKEDSHREEAAFVAQKIHTMLQSGTKIRNGDQLRRLEPEDIVILLRSPGSIGKYYQQELEKCGVRCATGGENDLLQTQEIGTLRSFLQTIVNPRQDIPLLSTLASPIFGFTADELAEIRSKNKKVSIYDALLENDLPRTKSFLNILFELRRLAKTSTLTQLLEQCFTLTRMDSIYASMPEGMVKQENLQRFYQLAVSFEGGSLRDLGQFLDHLQALEGKGLIQGQNVGAGCVTIMSIHKSKGLEFPVVFLCGLSRGFNKEGLRAQILCDKALGLGMSIPDFKTRIRYPSIAKYAIMAKMAAEGLSEEMRVLYVAMTRARDRMIMTYASKTLETDIREIALRMNFDNGKLVCLDAASPGKWVLLTALERMEAGQLHALGERPEKIYVSDYPWHIELVPSVQDTVMDPVLKIKQESVPLDVCTLLKNSLDYVYPYLDATHAPSKQTATGRKGREKDKEAAELAQETRNIHRTWRTPGFLSSQVEGKSYGNAVHCAMQYISYSNCVNEEAVMQEIQRLIDSGFLKPEQGQMINCKKIAAFFASDIGKKLVSGVPHIREFKFSILDDAEQYGKCLPDEKVLLQGVVDCALLEEDGITIVDFKTDYVTEHTIKDVIEEYRPQIETYGDALGKIFEMPIKKQYLYFFRLDRFAEV